MSTARNSLTCKNCKVAIPVPDIGREDLALFRSDAQHRNVLCLECRHVYEYHPEDCQVGPSDPSDGTDLASKLEVFTLWMKCETEGCEGQVAMSGIGPSQGQQAFASACALGPLFQHELPCEPARHLNDGPRNYNFNRHG
jgi:hypothetical protein